MDQPIDSRREILGRRPPVGTPLIGFALFLSYACLPLWVKTCSGGSGQTSGQPGSGAFDLRHQHPKSQRVLLCRQGIESCPGIGHATIAVTGAHHHQPTVHFEMSPEPW